MSSRALRKAQREREEQERLKRLEEDKDEDESDEEEASVEPAKKSTFALLGDVEEDSDGQDEVAPAQEDSEPPEPAAISTPASSAKKKKRKKKSKKSGGEGLVHAEKDEQLDEIDKALKQLSTNGNASLSGTTMKGSNGETVEICKLLAIDTNHLHAQNEMRRLFGRAALEQQDEEQPGQQQIAGNRRQQRRVQQVGLAQALRGPGGAQGRHAGGLAATALRRNIFIQGKDEWPTAASGGLGMEVEEKRADGTILYRFVHNRVYQDVQAQFQIAVESMDPNRLVVLLQHNPYHISTLLQVSEIAKQERDHATAGDLLQRALFSFGRAVHSTFARTLAEGKARLDFRLPENREFWLASWRYMQNLSMRATWRTVYEWAKLLLSLAPENDPYAIWLVLDQYALRARQDLDFLNMSRNPILKAVHGSMPNVQLSQGLAEHRAGNKSKGKQALFTAVGRFPWMVARLMRELGVDAPPAIWGKEPRTDKESLFAELYATRAKDLWNIPENSSLLLEVASALPPDTPMAEPDQGEIERNAARHVILSDVPALIAMVPRRYTGAVGSASDPLPPSDSYPPYLPSDLIRPGGGDRESTLRETRRWEDLFWEMPHDLDRDEAEAAIDAAAEDLFRFSRQGGRDMEFDDADREQIAEIRERLREAIGQGRPDLESDREDVDVSEDVHEEEQETGGRHARVEDVEDDGD